MKKLLLLSLVLLTAAPQARAVSEAAVLFLLIQPSVQARGLAGASVATSNHSPLSVFFNPAHIGFATAERSVNLQFYPSKAYWLPQFNLDDLYYEAKAFVAGYDLSRINKKIPVSIGAGYSRVFINLGEQIITDETGPEPIGTFNSSEHADVWSIGLAIDFYLRVGVGLNFKSIESNLSFVGVGAEPGAGSATANAHDFGILAQVPIVEIISKISQKPLTISEHFQPFLVPAFGFSKSNIGDEISYTDAGPADPLPRVARMGASLGVGIAYRSENVNLRIFSYEWSSEAEDLLVERDETGQFSYESGVGEIDFIENVLKSNASEDVITSNGWEVNLLDIVLLRQGRYKDPGGLVLYDASGYGINFVNILRITGLLYSDLLENKLLKFISDHVDIQYDHSSLDIEAAHPLAGTTFNGLTIRLF